MIKPGRLAEIEALTPEIIRQGIVDRYGALTPEQEEARERLGLTYPQAQIFFCDPKYRYRTVVAGRRFGKTVLAMHEVIRAVQGRGRRVAYVAPTLKQARKIFWRELKSALPRDAVESNSTSLEMWFKDWDSLISLYGADGENAENIRGIHLDFVVIDECKDVADHVWPQIIMPALAASDTGDALFIGTPGQANNWFLDMYTNGLTENNDPFYEIYKTFEYTTIEGGNVSLDFVKQSARTMTDDAFRREFEAQFVNSGDVVYSNFDRRRNVTADAYDNGGTLLVGMDFNISPMSAVFASDHGKGDIRIFSEMEIYGGGGDGAGGTQGMVDEIKRRFPDWEQRGVVVYPDPSGRQRRTSSSATDIQILRQAGFNVIAPLKAPYIRDRVNTVQAALLNAAGERRLLIHPDCKSLIKCLENLTYNPNDGKPEKRSGFDHIPDALGYMILGEMPLVKRHLGMAKIGGL